MQQAIEHRRRHGGIASEGRILLRERHVAGNDHRSGLLALRDRLEESGWLLRARRADGQLHR
jgi:hypothetical protein